MLYVGVTEFTVERSTLVPGAVPEDLDGHVLGQYLKACGAEDPVHTPAERVPWEVLHIAWDPHGDSRFDLINEYHGALWNPMMPARSAVECWIAYCFTQAGITATFVGEYAPCS